MLKFYRQNIGNIFLKEVNQRVDCYQYEVRNEDAVVSTMFSSASFSLIILPDATLRVERERRLFRKSHYKMFNHSTEALVATFEFPDLQSSSSARCIVRFEDETVYSFIEHNDHRTVFKSSTWNSFRFNIANSENFISFYGTQAEGEIECTNENILLPILSGLFIIDEKFRLLSESN